MNVLKVPHHGSENNITPDFVSKVTADRYIFCCNGEHHNPDLRILQLIIDSRIGYAAFRANNPLADGPFKFWFNSSETATNRSGPIAHLKQVQALIAAQQATSGGQMTAAFLQGKAPSFQLTF